MRRNIVLLFLGLCLFLSGCKAASEAEPAAAGPNVVTEHAGGHEPIGIDDKEEEQMDTRVIQETTPEEEEGWLEITVTIGDAVLDGVLFDNDTAHAFAELLPLTVDLWDPAPGFAKAFDLEVKIPEAPRTRNYEKGGLAYWYEGPSVAIFFSDHLEQTIVPVVNIGRLTSDVSVFQDYMGSVTIEKKEAADAAEP